MLLSFLSVCFLKFLSKALYRLRFFIHMSLIWQSDALCYHLWPSSIQAHPSYRCPCEILTLGKETLKNSLYIRIQKSFYFPDKMRHTAWKASFPLALPSSGEYRYDSYRIRCCFVTIRTKTINKAQEFKISTTIDILKLLEKCHHPQSSGLII